VIAVKAPPSAALVHAASPALREELEELAIVDATI